MSDGPKKSSGPSITTFLNQQSADANALKKRKPDEVQSDFKDLMQAPKSTPDKEFHTDIRLAVALREPARSISALSRLDVCIQKDQVDPSSGRHFKKMLENQSIRSRPLIVSRCLCIKHGQDPNKNNKSSHPEFMDGNIIYEATEANKRGPSGMESFFNNNSSTKKQRMDIEDFIGRDFEFWAYNPRRMTADVIANKSTITKENFLTDTALETLLSCDIKTLDEEDEIDQTYAYVIAGLYHSGYLVNKDEELAAKSIRLLKNNKMQYCQAESLRLSMDVNIRVFASLILSGVDPHETDEHGWSTVDRAQANLKGKTPEEFMEILRSHEHL